MTGTPKIQLEIIAHVFTQYCGANGRNDSLGWSVGKSIVVRSLTVQSVEEIMTSQRIPNTDSIEELARFWDTHDLTDFQAELQEVRTPVFSRRKEAESK